MPFGDRSVYAFVVVSGCRPNREAAGWGVLEHRMYLGSKSKQDPMPIVSEGGWAEGLKKKVHPLVLSLSLAPSNSVGPNGDGGLRSPEEHNSYLRNLHLNTYHIFVCLSGRSLRSRLPPPPGRRRYDLGRIYGYSLEPGHVSNWKTLPK